MKEMYHHTIVEHDFNNNFIHCDYRMSLPIDAVLIYAIIVAIHICTYIIYHYN